MKIRICVEMSVRNHWTRIIINYVLSMLMMKMKIIDVRLLMFTDKVFRRRKPVY